MTEEGRRGSGLARRWGGGTVSDELRWKRMALRGEEMWGVAVCVAHSRSREQRPSRCRRQGQVWDRSAARAGNPAWTVSSVGSTGSRVFPGVRWTGNSIWVWPCPWLALSGDLELHSTDLTGVVGSFVKYMRTFLGILIARGVILLLGTAQGCREVCGPSLAGSFWP